MSRLRQQFARRGAQLRAQVARRAVRLRGKLARLNRVYYFGLAALLALITINSVFIYQLYNEEAPPPTPTFTYTGVWNLLELQQHIDSGEVVGISVYDGAGAVPAVQLPPAFSNIGGRANASPPASPAAASTSSLVARTRDGQLIKVITGVSVADALVALRSLGYADLLTAEAIERLPRPVSGVAEPSDGPWNLASTLIIFLVVGVILFFFIRYVRRQSAMAGGSNSPGSVTDPSKEKVGDTIEGTAIPALTWADVAGCEEAKYELIEVVEFLRAPERFAALGAKIPRGVMLHGPSGTGKTLLAKIVAAEAGVPFISAAGSDFVEMFVGRGAARVRSLFAQARKFGKAVVFIDEFDAVGKKRGGLNSHDEREQTLNAILVEMDGFAANQGVVVIGATNLLHVLDTAVLRPGRFTRKVEVALPDVDGRRQILAVHARGKPLGPDVSIDDIASQTFGMSGADLADLLNEAAIFAAREHLSEIEQRHLEAAWEKVGIGASRKRSMPLRERAIIAAHEAGHAICGARHGISSEVKVISLYAHGQALGYTASAPKGDQSLPSEQELRARLIALMGGRMAEELLFQQYTGGASNDFRAATELATQMVTLWGMGSDPTVIERGITGRGPLSFIVADEHGKFSADLQPMADRAIAALLDEAVRAARATLLTEMKLLRAVSAYLVRHERMEGKVLYEILAGTLKVEAADEEWRPSESLPRQWDQIAPWAATSYRSAPAVPPPAVSQAVSPPPASTPVQLSKPRRRSLLAPLTRRLAAAVLRVLEEERGDRGLGGA